MGCCPPFRKGIIMSVSHLIRRLRGASFRKCVLAVCCIAVSFPSAGDESAAEARRAKLLSRPRRVIFNNDGCEMFFMPLKEPLIENFLKLRHTGLLDKKVDVISYCATATAFFSDSIGSRIAEHPRAGERIRAFRKLGTDALSESIRFAHANGMESFWSMRMNDCHDAFQGCEDLFPPFKRKHPDYLFGTAGKRPPYGFWSGIDYGRREVREMVEKLIEEVLGKYEIDGIDLDFCRHWTFFRSAAEGREPSQEELDALTQMMRNIRRAADRAGAGRSRPILILVRVLDSVEACRAQGIDLERWCAESLVDLVAGGSEIRLNQPDYLGRLARKYPNVKFYMVQTEAQMSGQHPVLLRNRSVLNFRGQAAAAYEGGVHGVYSFNEYFPHLGSSKYLGEIHDRNLLAGLNKFYYFSHSYTPAERHGRGWERFQKMPSLTPVAPEILNRDGVELELFTGRENSGASLRLLLDVRGIAPEQVEAEFNGVSLGAGEALDTLAVFHVPEHALRAGRNRVKIRSSAVPAAETLFTGSELLVYGVNQGTWRRLYGAEGFVPGKSEAIVEGAYRLCDVSDREITNLARPLNATPDGRIEICFEAKILESSAPDAAVLRLADGKHAEVLQFLTDGIRLRNAGQSFAFDADGAFHNYRVIIEKGTVAVFVDDAEAMKAPLKTPHDRDAGIVVGRAGEKPAWLSGNSLILGSLSPEGTGAALFRNFTLRNNRMAGRLFDGALLVVHNPEAEDIPVALTEPLRTPDGENTSRIILAPGNADGWKMLSANSTNLVRLKHALRLDNRKIGPVISHPLPDAGKMLELCFSYRAVDLTCPKAQLGGMVILNAPDGKSQLWGYRFGRDYVRFLDEGICKFTPSADGVVRCRMLADPRKGVADLYVNGSEKPVLRNRAFITAGREQCVSFGDGSVAIEGMCELYGATATLYGVSGQTALRERRSADAAPCATLTPQNRKKWNLLSFNKDNLHFLPDRIRLDNRKTGPVIQYLFEKTPENLAEIDVSFRVVDAGCGKAQLQVAAVVDAADGKSLLWGYRFGRDHVRFTDNRPQKLVPDADGMIRAKILIDPELGVGEVYLNGSTIPVLRDCGLAVPRKKAGVSLGDGSIAVEGICELHEVTVKLY